MVELHVRFTKAADRTCPTFDKRCIRLHTDPGIREQRTCGCDGKDEDYRSVEHCQVNLPQENKPGLESICNIVKTQVVE